MRRVTLITTTFGRKNWYQELQRVPRFAAVPRLHNHTGMHRRREVDGVPQQLGHVHQATGRCGRLPVRAARGAASQRNELPVLVRRLCGEELARQHGPRHWQSWQWNQADGRLLLFVLSQQLVVVSHRNGVFVVGTLKFIFLWGSKLYFWCVCLSVCLWYLHKLT